MFGGLKRIWKAAPVATLSLAGAVLVALFFTAKSVMFWIYWSDPANRDRTIEAWMTPGYVAHSWYVPRDVVLDAINAPRGKDRRPRNFDQLAEFLGVPAEELIEQAQAAIDDYRMLNPAPPREDQP